MALIKDALLARTSSSAGIASARLRPISDLRAPWPSRVHVAVQPMALKDSHRENKSMKTKAKLTSGSWVLRCPALIAFPGFRCMGWYLPLWLPQRKYNYLSSSDTSLEKQACGPVRCCSISSRCSRKPWQSICIASISWAVP